MKHTRTKNRKVPPRHLREISAEMKRKALTLSEVAAKARIPQTTASSILSGSLINPDYLARIALFVQAAPMPEDVCA